MSVHRTYSPSWRAKGQILLSLNKQKEAIVCLEMAIEIDPRDAQAWLSKGAALERMGRVGDAQKCFDFARALKEA